MQTDKSYMGPRAHAKLQILGLFCELIDHLNLAFIPYSTGETINLLHKGGKVLLTNNILPPLCLVRT